MLEQTQDYPDFKSVGALGLWVLFQAGKIFGVIVSFWALDGFWVLEFLLQHLGWTGTTSAHLEGSLQEKAPGGMPR